MPLLGEMGRDVDDIGDELKRGEAEDKPGMAVDGVRDPGTARETAVAIDGGGLAVSTSLGTIKW